MTCYALQFYDYRMVKGGVYMTDIGINISSCIEGVNVKTCKNLFDIMPNRFLKIFANSLF